MEATSLLSEVATRTTIGILSSSVARRLFAVRNVAGSILPRRGRFSLLINRPKQEFDIGMIGENL